MRDDFVKDLAKYVEQTKHKYRHKDVRDNERATEWSLVAPMFTILGYDVSDPEQWAPQYKKSLGRGSVDFALLGENRRPIILVEVKPAKERHLLKKQKKSRQLTRYFNWVQVKLGILTSGVEWLFFTDYNNPKFMDVEPFERWDVRKEHPPVELLGILKKDVYDPKVVHDFVRGQLGEDNPGETLTIPPGVALKGGPELYPCDYCKKEFAVDRLPCLLGGPSPTVESRFCSNVCRGRGKQVSRAPPSMT